MSGAASKPGQACPICGKPVEAAFRPFCSRRCSDVDLGRWLTGAYVIAGTAEEDQTEVPDASETRN